MKTPNKVDFRLEENMIIGFPQFMPQDISAQISLRYTDGRMVSLVRRMQIIKPYPHHSPYTELPPYFTAING